MTYQPRLTDPRVRRRVVEAIRQVDHFLKPNQVHSLSQSLRRQWFGTTSNPLSQWLDQTLLETVDPHFNMNTGLCKKYRLRASALNNLKQQLGIETTYQLAPQLLDTIQTGDFDYVEKSDRWYSEAQFIPSKIRGDLLANAGYRYKYDIKAAAPTVLLQRAQQVNHNFQAPALTAYIQDRTAIRNRIAQEATVTVEQVKTVLNALLQGSFLSTWGNNKLYCVLNQDYDVVQRLKSSATLTAIRSDIRNLWQCLRDEFPVEYTTDKNSRQRRRKLSGRTKSAYYRKFERQIATVIQRSLRKQHSRFLWIHDGWQSDQMTDIVDLQSQVRRKTGFLIDIDWEIYED